MVVVIDPAAYARRQVRDQLAPLGCAVVELTGEEDPEALSEALARARVVVVEPARIVEAEPAGERALFVALTRPTRRLVVVHAEPLPAALR